MRKRLERILPDIKFGAAICGSCPMSFFACLPLLSRRRGQTTVEYLLMLSVVAGVALIMAFSFHRRILGGLFTMVGLIIGAGTPPK